ncbi:MAG: branched-chain amino acid ABC transporter permease [Bdellovibrionales bacterium]|nr:branched-chain amino acid ABC transporter permease [Bdellovibrionales bacterium]
MSKPEAKLNGSPHGMKTLWPWIAALAGVIVVHFLVTDRLNPYFFTILMYAGVNATLAVSLNLISGFTGQFSMGHAGFMSVGGYVSAFITTSLAASHPDLINDPNLSPFVFGGVLVVAGLFSAFMGYLVGLPSLRLRGDYLAIVTLGFGEIIRVIVLNVDAIGGARGMPNIPELSSFAWVYGVLVVTLFSVWRLIHSRQGREFLAVREDEIAAEAMGVNTTKAKVRAFATGAFFAGVSGALFAHYLRYLNPQTFDFNRSFEVIIMVVLGGLGSLSGSVVAAIFLTVLKEMLRPLQELTKLDFRMVIYSMLLIVLMLTRPNGIFGTKEITSLFKRGRRSSKGGAT